MKFLSTCRNRSTFSIWEFLHFCHGILNFTYYWSVILKSIIVVSWISNTWPSLTHVKNLRINCGVSNSLWKQIKSQFLKIVLWNAEMENNLASVSSLQIYESCWNKKQLSLSGWNFKRIIRFPTLRQDVSFTIRKKHYLLWFWDDLNWIIDCKW